MICVSFGVADKSEANLKKYSNQENVFETACPLAKIELRMHIN
jgi:hypothetical protein